VYEAVESTPDAAKFPHANRWYRHIDSFGDAIFLFPGDKKSVSEFAFVVSSKPAAAEEDDDIDLFGSDEEDDAEAERLKAERVAAYKAKKSTKPALIAKSSITFDVKPWDDETDLKEMEKLVRSIQLDGLVWGASKLVPVGYGINKLRIICVVEDDKVSTDMLEETIKEFEDHVQSVDIEAFAKI
jgi:elongation factor 1-beta